MKAARFHEYGGPEVLRYEDAPDPLPGPGEALVRVRACGLNHVDLDHRSGLSRFPHPLPFILGYEIAGDVLALPPGVSAPAIGTRVLVPYSLPCWRCALCRSGRDHICPNAQRFGGNRHGGYAELVAAPAEALIPLPDSLGYEEAAATQLAFGTAWHMLLTRGQLRPGETVLINAAGSGIGSAAVQIAKLAGARIIASAGSDEKLERARALGADHVINYRTTNMTTAAMEMTDGRGVDLVFEHVGGELFTQALRALALDGRLAICGAHGGETTSVDLIDLFRREVRVIGSRVYTRQELLTIMDLVGTGRLRPLVHAVLPLAEAPEGHRILERREQFGKVVLRP